MKTLEEFREQYLRLIRQLCPGDPEYVEQWMRTFDQQNGVKLRPSSRLRLLNVGIRKRGVSSPTEKSAGNKYSRPTS
jgi:hypothetical protein